MALLIVSFVLNIIPIIVVPMLYTNIPNTISAYVDFMGKVMISVEKTKLQFFVCLFMGIIFSTVCLIMYTVKLPALKQKYNKIIWSILALIGALKMARPPSVADASEGILVRITDWIVYASLTRGGSGCSGWVILTPPYIHVFALYIVPSQVLTFSFFNSSSSNQREVTALVSV